MPFVYCFWFLEGLKVGIFINVYPWKESQAKVNIQLGLRQIKPFVWIPDHDCLWNCISGYLDFIDYLLKSCKSLHRAFFLIHPLCSCCVFKGIARDGKLSQETGSSNGVGGGKSRPKSGVETLQLPQRRDFVFFFLNCFQQLECRVR